MKRLFAGMRGDLMLCLAVVIGGAGLITLAGMLGVAVGGSL
jgi:hypothetical protein